MEEAGHLCPVCSEQFDYWRAHCRNGHLVGFPNHRAALAQREVLVQRHRAASDDARSRRVEHLLPALERLAEDAQPVIAMGFAACDDIMRPAKYRNYHQRVDSGERNPAGAIDHGDREMVGERLFPGYSQHMHYAALSPDGMGLPSYGPIAVRWRVSAEYLGQRASLVEENSFRFYNRFGLGHLGATVPSGYQAIWNDKVSLTTAKLASALTPATAEGDLAGLFLRPGSNRSDDEFIEVVIYAEHGIDTRDVDRVSVLRPATTNEERLRAELIREVCARRRIDFVG